MTLAFPTPLPFDLPDVTGPLGRFLPHLPISALQAWLEQVSASQPGAWLIDPFGSAPGLAVATARTGMRVLVAANNPVQRFLLELCAQPPSADELRSVLAELAGSFKGSERLELHLRALYESHCGQCGAVVEVTTFLWERGAAAPYARIYECKACGAKGEFPATSHDAELAERFTRGGLHYARALERVAPAGDVDREHAEEALSVYLPRAVYVLFTLINKLDGLNVTPHRQALLQALVLHACDQGASLEDISGERERPRQLSIPPRFREHNLWLALEQGVNLFASETSPVPLVNWPELPPESGGICLFEGPLRELSSHFQAHDPGIQFQSAVTVLPRPNQAFWTLSALWAGWLWGRDAAGPFKSVLRRRRYDWAWHTTALQAAFERLAELLKPGVQFLALSSEAEPGLLGSAIIAAQASRFQLTGMGFRGSSTHLLWELDTGRIPASALTQNQLMEAVTQAGRDLLLKLGQPTSYPRLNAAILGKLAVNGQLPANPENPAENFNLVQATLKETLTFRQGFRRFAAGETLDTGQYWLREEGGAAEPLADQVEKAMVNALLKHPGSSLETIDRLMCQAFPGLLTPELELVHACLDSYGIQQPPESKRWELRPPDAPAARRIDLENMRQQITQLGQRLGFSVSDGTPLLWQDERGQIHFIFFPIVSAVIGGLLGGTLPAEQAVPVIVLPGGRANLVAYKQRRNPRLAQLSQSWSFLKARHLRLLLESSTVNPDNLKELIAQDPLTYAAPQMRLL